MTDSNSIPFGLCVIALLMGIAIGWISKTIVGGWPTKLISLNGMTLTTLYQKQHETIWFALVEWEGGSQGANRVFFVYHHHRLPKDFKVIDKRLGYTSE